LAARWLARQGDKCCFNELVKGKLSELSILYKYLNKLTELSG